MNFLKNLKGRHKIIMIIVGVIFFGFLAYKLITEYILPYLHEKDINPVMIVYSIAFVGTVYAIGKYLKKW